MTKTKDLLSLVDKDGFGFSDKERSATVARLEGKKGPATIINTDEYYRKLENLFAEVGMSLEVMAVRHREIIQGNDKKTALSALRLGYELLGVLNNTTAAIPASGVKNQQINIFQGMKTEDLQKEVAALAEQDKT